MKNSENVKIRNNILYAVLWLLILSFTMFIVLIGYASFIQKDNPTYVISSVIRRDISQEIIATGKVTAVQLVAVGSQASGQIKRLYVKIGQKVKKGELIAEIDSTNQRNELHTGRAILETHKSKLASQVIALRIAQQQFIRESKLKSQDATSHEQYENIENVLAKAKSDVAETRSLITQAEIAVSTAEANLGYTMIVSPINGTVISIPIEEGQTVNASQTIPTIIQIADLSHMKINIKISEGDITKIETGMNVVFYILSDKNTEYISPILSIDPAPVTVSDGDKDEKINLGEDKAVYYYGRLIVNNSKEKLRIGMTTQCIIRIGFASNVLSIPSEAIHKKDGKKYVLVLKDNKEKEIEIITGISDSMNTEIISGIESDDVIITALMTDNEVL